MHDRLFYSSLESINTIQSEIVSTKKNNDKSFRRISKEVFSKSFSKIEFQDSLELGYKMLEVGIASAIKKAKRQYKTGSFTRSFHKTNPYANHVTYSDLVIVLKFLNYAEFDTVLKLLKHNRKFGFKHCLNILK